MLIGTVPSRYSNAPQECTPLLPGTVCAGGRNRERRRAARQLAMPPAAGSVGSDDGEEPGELPGR